MMNIIMSAKMSTLQVKQKKTLRISTVNSWRTFVKNEFILFKINVTMVGSATYMPHSQQRHTYRSNTHKMLLMVSRCRCVLFR